MQCSSVVVTEKVKWSVEFPRTKIPKQRCDEGDGGRVISRSVVAKFALGSALEGGQRAARCLAE